jgi:hypothetical protein
LQLKADSPRVVSEVVFKLPFWAIAEKQVKAYARKNAQKSFTKFLSNVEKLRGM